MKGKDTAWDAQYFKADASDLKFEFERRALLQSTPGTLVNSSLGQFTHDVSVYSTNCIMMLPSSQCSGVRLCLGNILRLGSAKAMRVRGAGLAAGRPYAMSMR